MCHYKREQNKKTKTKKNKKKKRKTEEAVNSCSRSC